MKNLISIKILILAMVINAAALNAYAQKVSPDEIVVKHLDSIGTKEARDKIQNQLVAGNVEFSIKGTTSSAAGKGLILSAGDKNLWAINFASSDYSQERFGFNGKETKVGFARPGAYSNLGRFIYSFREVVKEGLLGGTLSSSWALLNTSSRKSKISFDGIKKIDGKDAYVLSYLPKGGSDLTIKMFFDTQNYQHVRTEYSRVIPAQMAASVDASAGQGETRLNLIEQFSNFQKLGNLMLPGNYKLSYSYYNATGIQQAGNSNRDLELRFKLTSFTFNEPLEPSSFEIKGN